MGDYLRNNYEKTKKPEQRGCNNLSAAMAILKSGRSYDEASKVTGIPVDQIMAEWAKQTPPKTLNHVTTC